MAKQFIVETSARHIHVSEADLKVLFGENAKLTPKKDLSQPGQYACEERVTVVGPKKEIKGVSIHTGSAKGIMINSQHLAMEFFNKLPKELDPALTSGYEGFNHLNDLNGSVNETSMSYIIRNHDIGGGNTWEN